jgi:excisionase family DNA binding protein
MGEDITVSEAAKILGYSDAHVRELITEGKLPARRFSPRVQLLNSKDVEQYKKELEKLDKQGPRKGRPRKGKKG